MVIRRLLSLGYLKKPTYEDLVNGTPQLARLFKLNEEYQHGKSLFCGLKASNFEHLYKSLIYQYRTLQQMGINY